MAIEDLQVANINNEEGGWIDLPKTYINLTFLWIMQI